MVLVTWAISETSLKIQSTPLKSECMAEILRVRSTIGQRCANKLEVITDSEHLMHIDPNILLSRSEYEQNHVSKICTTMENFASFVKGIKFMKNSEQISVLVSPVLTVSKLSNSLIASQADVLRGS